MTLKVKVIPRSPRTEEAGTLADGTLRVKIAAPPEKGRANAILVDFLAQKYGVLRQNVAILSGRSAALKLVRITLPGGSTDRARK